MLRGKKRCHVNGGSAQTATPPRRQHRQRASATTTEDAAPFGPPNQTEMSTTMLETILNLMKRTRMIESYVYEVFDHQS